MDNEVKIVVTSEDRTNYDPAKRNAEKAGDETGRKFSNAVERWGGRAGGRLSMGFRKGSKDAANAVKDIGAALKDIDSEIDQHRKKVKELSIEYAKTKDIDVFKKLKDSRQAVSSLQAVKKELQGFEKEAKESGKKMSGGLHSGLLEGKAKLMVAAVALALSFAGAFNAAIMAAGVGGTIGIAALVLKDEPALVRGALRMVDRVKSIMKQAAQPMVKPLATALDSIGNKMSGLAPLFRQIFANAAPMVSRLVDAFFALVSNILPAFNHMLASSGPIMDALVDGATQLGRDIGWALTIMTGDAEKSADSLRALFEVMGRLVILAAGLMRGLQYIFDPFMQGILKTKEVLRNFFAALSKAPGPIGDLASTLVRGIDALSMTSEQMNQASHSTANATEQTLRLKGAMSALASQMLAMSGSAIAFEEAIDNATASIKDNGRTLDINTAKGRANRQALDGIASSALAYADSIREAGGSTSKVNSVLGRAYTRFISAAKAAGMSKTAADRLARSYGLLPVAKNTRVTAKGAREAKAIVDGVRRSLNSLRSRTVQLTVKQVYKTYGAA